MSIRKSAKKVTPHANHDDTTRPLSALLSQILVAYTVEFNNEFEWRMLQAGYPGAGLSLGIWCSTMRFVSETGTSVRELATQALAPLKGKMFELGCLERWRFIELQPDARDQRLVPLAMHRMTGRERRAGWGSGRGIRPEWLVRATPKGLRAIAIWPSLLEEIDNRWERRFGKSQIRQLRSALLAVAEQFDTEFPDALSNHFSEMVEYPARRTKDISKLPLSALLSKLLMAFTLDYQRESRVPLAVSANTIRVLGKIPIRESELAQRTGVSREMSDIGWFLRRFVVREADPGGRRGKLVRLNPLGLAVQAKYWRVVGEIEKRWGEAYGRENIRAIREQLQELFTQRVGERRLLAEGLLPPEGVMRAGQLAPALGRREPGPAARQRMRDLVEQTAAFVRDPANTLPHYPMWDMNRGFGP